MRLTLDKDSFKHFSKIMLTSAKLGDDLFFECRLDDFTIKSVNETRSMFFFTKFNKRFFEEYQLTEQIECKFKSKSCILPFKPSAQVEKNMRSMEFFVDKGKDSATFQMSFDSNDLSVHEINYVNTNLQILLDEEFEFKHYLEATNKNLVNLFGIFPNSNEYCVMSAEPDKIYFETYNFKMNEVRTKFVVNSDIFAEYNISEKIQTTFLLKPLKTFLNSMDRNASCFFYFEDDDCPIHVVIRNDLFENKFIIASIDVDIDSYVEQPTGSVHMPREIVSADLQTGPDEETNDSGQVSNTNDGRSSSSYTTGESISLTTKQDDPTGVNNERYKSIYTSRDSTSQGSLKEFAVEDVRHQSTQNDQASNPSASNRSTGHPPANNRSVIHRSTNNSELLTPDEDQQQFSQQNGHRSSQQPNVSRSSQQNGHRTLQQSVVSSLHHNSKQNSQIYTNQNSQLQTPVVEFDDMDFDDIEFDNFDEDIEMDAIPVTETSTTRTSTTKTSTTKTNVTKLNTTEANVSKTNTSKLNATETNAGLEGADQSREPNGSQIRSAIEEDDRMSSLEMDEDLLLNEHMTESSFAINQKTSYDNFLNKMPSMSNGEHLDERRKSELFTDFMNKHRNQLP